MLLTIVQLLLLLSGIECTSMYCEKKLTPARYELTYQLDMYKMVVYGKYRALFWVLNSTDTIILDKFPGMKVTQPKVRQENVLAIKSTNAEYENGSKYRIVLNGTLAANTYLVLDLDFRYKSGGKSRDGFYIGEMSPAWYTHGNHKRIFAATYLSATGCRKAFPCVSCPYNSFSLKLNVKTYCDDLNCDFLPVSNVYIMQTSIDSNSYKLHSFPESQKISYKHLALFVSSIQPIKIEDQVIYSRIWDERDKMVRTFALTAKKSQEFFENMFGQTFNEYLQHVVVPDKGYPEDVHPLYGLVFYKEPYLAIDYGLNREEKKRKINGAVARQFFFGFRHNFTELGQFTEKAFGKYLEYLEVHPSDWKVSDTFTVDVLHVAMETYKDEASVLYKPSKDYTMLLRSAAFLRYFEHVLTKPVFKEVLHQLVNKELVMTDHDVLKIFEMNLPSKLKAEGFPYQDVIYEMLKTPGYPVLSIYHNHTGGDGSFIIQQQWYTQFPKQPSDKLLYIPISYGKIGESFENTCPEVIVPDEKQFEVSCSMDSCKDLIFNAQQTGFFRVNYDVQTWIHIRKNLRENHTSIHVLNRAQLIDDAFALADGEIHPYQIALGLSTYLRKETSLAPWIAFFRGIRSIELWFKYCGKQIAIIAFENFVNDLIHCAFAKDFVKFLAPPDDHIRLMSLVLPYLCKRNHEVCQEIAQNMLSTKDTVKHDISLLHPVYCWALKNGHPIADWDELKDEYMKSVSIGDIVAIVNYRKALVCGGKNDIMWYLRYAVRQGLKKHKQEATDIFLEVIESAENGYRLTLRYLTLNIRKANQSLILSKVLLKLAEVTYLPEQMKEFSSLMKLAVRYINMDGIKRQLHRNYNWSVRHHTPITIFLELQHMQYRLERLIALGQTIRLMLRPQWQKSTLYTAFIATFVCSLLLLRHISKLIESSWMFVREKFGGDAGVSSAEEIHIYYEESPEQELDHSNVDSPEKQPESSNGDETESESETDTVVDANTVHEKAEESTCRLLEHSTATVCGHEYSLKLDNNFESDVGEQASTSTHNVSNTVHYDNKEYLLDYKLDLDLEPVEDNSEETVKAEESIPTKFETTVAYGEYSLKLNDNFEAEGEAEPSTCIQTEREMRKTDAKTHSSVDNAHNLSESVKLPEEKKSPQILTELDTATLFYREYSLYFRSDIIETDETSTCRQTECKTHKLDCNDYSLYCKTNFESDAKPSTSVEKANENRFENLSESVELTGAKKSSKILTELDSATLFYREYSLYFRSEIIKSDEISRCNQIECKTHKLDSNDFSLGSKTKFQSYANPDSSVGNADKKQFQYSSQFTKKPSQIPTKHDTSTRDADPSFEDDNERIMKKISKLFKSSREKKPQVLTEHETSTRFYREYYLEFNDDFESGETSNCHKTAFKTIKKHFKQYKLLSDDHSESEEYDYDSDELENWKTGKENWKKVTSCVPAKSKTTKTLKTNYSNDSKTNFESQAKRYSAVENVPEALEKAEESTCDPTITEIPADFVSDVGEEASTCTEAESDTAKIDIKMCSVESQTDFESDANPYSTVEDADQIYSETVGETVTDSDEFTVFRTNDEVSIFHHREYLINFSNDFECHEESKRTSCNEIVYGSITTDRTKYLYDGLHKSAADSGMPSHENVSETIQETVPDEIAAKFKTANVYFQDNSIKFNNDFESDEVEASTCTEIDSEAIRLNTEENNFVSSEPDAKYDATAENGDMPDFVDNFAEADENELISTPSVIEDATIYFREYSLNFDKDFESDEGVGSTFIQTESETVTLGHDPF